ATVVTVTTTPAVISNNSAMCAGSSITLSDATGGGAWSSSNASIATVGSATGTVTGIAGGTARITYSIGGGCNVTAIVTVNAVVGTINGASSVCIGSAITLSDATTGGTWSS